MNDYYYENKNENFQQALSLCEQVFSHEELLKMLKNGNIPQKQLAALYFDKVETVEDASALLNNLTGCDGKIREAVAYKIHKHVYANENAALLFADLSPKIYADASIDINANICRLVIDIVKKLKMNKEFSINYVNNIVCFTEEAFDKLDKFIFKDKKYVINKQLFKLYWCLEALKSFYEFVPEEKLLSIVQKAANQNEYTIREKAAELIIVTSKFPKIKEQLTHDENYYVREALKSS